MTLFVWQKRYRVSDVYAALRERPFPGHLPGMLNSLIASTRSGERAFRTYVRWMVRHCLL